MPNSYVIVPCCSDLNRGDQALVWETRKVAEDAGLKGKYYFTSEANEPVVQSEERGFTRIFPVLEHPSRKFKNKENVQYNLALKIKWGIVALGDLAVSLCLLTKPGRKLLKPLLPTHTRESLEVMENMTALLVKGGGFFQFYGGFTSSYTAYFDAYHIFLASRLGKPVYMMPNSMGPFEGPMVRWLVRKALSKCSIVSTRESLSRDMTARELGIDSVLSPDLAFNLKPAQLDRCEVFAAYGVPADRKVVAITVRPYRFPNAIDPKVAYESFKRSVADFIAWLYDRGYIAVLVNHTLAVNSHENDFACITDIVEMLPEECYRVISNADYDCRDLKRLYSFCDYIVGTRFHSVIFSLASGVPGLAISYVGNKSIGIMADMGLSDYVLHIDSVTADELKNKFSALVQSEGEVKTKLEAYMAKMPAERQALVELIEDAREML